MVEVEIAPETPVALLIPFAIHTAVLIFVHLLSLMLAICLLPELEATGATPNPQIYHAALKIAKSRSIQVTWILSNVVGVSLFLVELILIAFIKFYPTDDAPSSKIHAATATLATVIVLALFLIPAVVVVSRSLSKYKLQFHEQRLGHAQQMLEEMNQQIVTTDAHTHTGESVHPDDVA